MQDYFFTKEGQCVMMGSTRIQPTQFAISWASPLLAQNGVQEENGLFKTITGISWTR